MTTTTTTKNVGVLTLQIYILMLFSTSEPSRAATLLVSNELQTCGDVPVFVTCQPTPRLSKLEPLGQKLLIEVPTTAVDEKASGCRVWQPTICVGTFYSEDRSERGTRNRTFCTIRTKILRSVKIRVSLLLKTMDFIVGTTIRSKSGKRFFRSFGISKSYLFVYIIFPGSIQMLYFPLIIC